MRKTTAIQAALGGAPLLGALLAATIPTTMVPASAPAWHHSATAAPLPRAEPPILSHAPPQDLSPTLATMRERVLARRLAAAAQANAAASAPIGFASYAVEPPAPLPGPSPADREPAGNAPDTPADLAAEPVEPLAGG